MSKWLVLEPVVKVGDWLNLKVNRRYQEIAASDPSQGHSGSSSKLMFVPFLARRARFRLALCGPGRFFGIFVSWKYSWWSEQEHLRM